MLEETAQHFNSFQTVIIYIYKKTFFIILTKILTKHSDQI